MNNHPIYLNGEPINLEAAAYDALTWLESFSPVEHFWVSRGAQPRFAADLLLRLDRTIAALQTYLPGVDDCEFRESEQPAQPPPDRPPSGVVFEVVASSDGGKP